MLLTSRIKTRIVPLNIVNLSRKYGNLKLNDILEIDIIDLSEKSPIIIDCKCEVRFLYIKDLKII